VGGTQSDDITRGATLRADIGGSLGTSTTLIRVSWR
jgi:hypothetical protein